MAKDAGDYLTGKQVAEQLGISSHLLGLLRICALSKHQVTDCAPWWISRFEVESEKVSRLVAHMKRTDHLL